MEEEVLMAENGSLEFHDEELVQINGVLKENENPDVDILEDLDAYWNELNDRLTISRVVSDSIVRGMVTAIESEAAEMIAQKDLELSRMKETLLLYHVGSEENEAAETSLMHNKMDFGNTDVFLEHGRTKESRSSLKTEARKQLVMLVQELTNLRRHIHTNGVNTLGLGSNSMENGSKTVDKMLDSLKSTLETVLKRKNETEPPSSWQQEHEFKTEIESVVLTSFVRSLKDEYGQKLRKQEAEFGDDRRSLLCEKIKEITSLRQELMFISKTLSDHENGEIDAGTIGNRKKTESLHRKISGSLSFDTNGKKHEECFVGSVPENIEALNHLSRDDLINHFNTVINKMKRDHDYEVQGMTEQYFTLKREYLNLKERGSLSHVKKDKELVALKMKIPMFISKLDKILIEDEKLVSEGKNNTDFKSQLDSLLLENRKLNDSLLDATEKMQQLSQIEANHQKLIQKLESEVEDSHVGAIISEDVYRCVVMEFVGQAKSAKQKTDLELSEMREAYELKESCKSRDDLEDFCVESLTEECCVVIYKEILKEADKKIEEMNIHVSEQERALRSEVLEKETLKKDIDLLNCLVKEKEDLVHTLEKNLAKETEKFKLVSKQNNDLQCQIDQQKTEIQEKNEALRVLSSQEQEKVKDYEKKIHDLRQELAVAREDLKKTKDEKKTTEEKLTATKAAEEKLKKQLLSLDTVPSKLIKGFDMLESLVAEKTQKTNSRLKDLENQFSVLSHQMYEVKEKAMTYKQRLEKKCCDLKKAEAEVDVLGDEVESFLDLLEKIYIALDHYSPILKHYPGIIEILKLVRRELSGETKRNGNQL